MFQKCQVCGILPFEAFPIQSICFTYKDGDDDDGDTAVGSCEKTDSARQKKSESVIEQFSAKEIFFQILLKQFYCHGTHADRRKQFHTEVQGIKIDE